MFLIEIGKLLAFFRKPLQKPSRLPEFAVLFVESFNAVEDFSQTNRVGVPHWPAAMGGEAVAVQVDDVDVARAEGVAFLKNARAFVD